MPLRILLACARPLIHTFARCEVTLSEAAGPHAAAATAVLDSLGDHGPLLVDGRTLRFEVYPPNPPQTFIEARLKAAVPLVSVRLRPDHRLMDVHRPGEELAALQKELADVGGVELHVHAAATLPDVQAFLRDHDVDALILVLHGDAQGGLYFEDGRGGARRVSPAELAQLVRGRVKLLLNGACYSEKSVAELFPLNAGEGIADTAAIAVDGEHSIETRAVQRFAGAFFASLVRGRDVATAFARGRDAVRVDDLVGERALPDGAEDRESPWKRFRQFGDPALTFAASGNAPLEVRHILTPTPHRKLARTSELFVGRQYETVAAIQALGPPRPGISEQKPRVVTFAGEGGIGKTRLSGAVAEWLAERGWFPGGIVEVDCERATNATGLALAILTRLGVDGAERLPDPAAALAEVLSGAARPRLLVLDNLDDLFARNGVDADATPAHEHPGTLLKTCLAAAPSLRILATCRWPLELGTDENCFELDPLAPEEAVELFIQSVHDQDVRRRLLAVSEARRMALLAGILNATERMPLALVLAARRLTGPGEDLATVLQRASEDLLTLCEDDRLRDLPPRLRSVRASVQLSYDRLSDPAKQLFARMSFFPDGLDRTWEPLDRVLGEGWQRVLHEEVVDAALARYDRARDRYTMLNPVLVFAQERLDEGEGAEFRRKVVELWRDVVVSMVAMLSPSRLSPDVLIRLNLPKGKAEREAALEQRRQASFETLLSEENNIIWAAFWALTNRFALGGALVAALGPFLDLKAMWQTQLRLYELAAESADDTSDALAWVGNHANVLRNLHQWKEARAEFETLLATFRQLAEADPETYLPNVATTLNNLGALLADVGERDAARAHYEEALALYRQLAARYPDAYLPDVAMTLNNLGALLKDVGERDAARSHYEEALALRRQLAARYPDAYLPDVAMTLNNLANLLKDVGERDAARSHYAEALALYRQLAARYPDAYLSYVAMTLNNLGALLKDVGERDAARAHYEEALALYWPFFVKYPDAYVRNVLIVLNGLGRVFVQLGLEEEAQHCARLIAQLTGSAAGNDEEAAS